jgi:hypothetical protein
LYNGFCIVNVLAVVTCDFKTVASVEELYGDSKDEDWKAEEVERIKAELGIATVEETSELNDVKPIGF